MKFVNNLVDSYNISLGHVIVICSICFLVLLVLSIVMLVSLINMKKKYKKFMMGTDGKSLEKEINDKLNGIVGFNKDIDKIYARLDSLKEVLDTSIQKVGIVKYDAFNEMGGKLSFVVALLSADNNGVVINCMHSREGCYTYAKEIIKGESYVMLADEEKQAIQEAIKNSDFMEKVG